MPWAKEKQKEHGKRVRQMKRNAKLAAQGDPEQRALVELRHLADQGKIDFTLPRYRIKQLLRGAPDSVMNLARLRSPKNQDCAAVVALWDKTPAKQRKKIEVETLCEQAGVDVSEFLGQIAAAGHKYSMDLVKLMASLRAPDLVDKSIEAALGEDGFKDRQLLLQSLGFAPSPKGIQIGIQQNTSIQQESSLPDFEHQIIDLVEVVRE